VRAHWSRYSENLACRALSNNLIAGNARVPPRSTAKNYVQSATTNLGGLNWLGDARTQGFCRITRKGSVRNVISQAIIRKKRKN
jgi:hypothetical protein